MMHAVSRWALIALVMLAAGAHSLCAQTGAARSIDVAADWQATFNGPHGERMVFRISKNGAGWRAEAYWIDHPYYPSSVPVVTVRGDMVEFTVTSLNGSFEGKVSADGNAIEGNWKQGNNGKVGFPTQAVTLTRATKDNAWPVPAPKNPPVMNANLDPSFEVDTVKPHDPSVPGGGWQWKGARRFEATMPVAGLIEDIYGIQKKQLLNAPDWAFKDVYDFVGVPDLPGWPTQEQRYSMERKLLEDRFQLKVHTEKRELPALVLSMSGSATKMTPSVILDPGVTFSFRRGATGGMVLSGINCKMGDLIRLLQMMEDKPVVDATGLTGQFDFDLNFTPDWMAPGASTTQADIPPPDLTTALEQQLGLKLSAAKTAVDVIVVDRLERPSPN